MWRFGAEMFGLARFSTACATFSALVFGIGVAAAQDPEGLEDDAYHFGIVEYEVSCLPCHGVDGRGDGPLAEYLSVPPSDLTRIAESNNGEFPALELFEIIDGRALVAAHGKREMPVWGDRYRAEVSDEQTRAEIETEALARIAALVRYIELLQDTGDGESKAE